MRIQHNIMAMNAYRNYNNNVNSLSKNLEKLSSGYRINRAGDDAAGLAISEKMRAQISGLDQAQNNVKDGISLVKTAEGALQEVQDMLNRMVTLATQSANGTYDNEVDRLNLQKEVDALSQEINRIADSANFNGINLLDGSLGLNEAAFTVGDAGAVAAAGNADITLTLGTVAAGKAHETALGNAQAAPSFTVDLGDVALSAATGGNNSAKIVVGGATMETSNTLGTNAMTTTEIRDAILTNKDAWTSKGKTSGNVKIGDFEFKVEAEGTTGLKFTYAGMNASTNPATTDKYTADQATALNGLLGSSVAYTGTTGTGAAATGDVQHNTMDVVQAKAEALGARAGIDLVVDANLVADGNVLTIDGKEFVFKTDATSDVEAAAGQELIDVSGFAANKQIEAAIDLLSNKETTNFDIESKDATTLHIDQKVGNTNEYKEADLKALFSAKTPGTDSGTALTIADNSKIVAGNSITVNGKTYTFGDKAGQIAIGADAEETLTNLQTALANDGVDSDVDGDTLTVYTKEGSSAPAAITGGGLTLQIGDTSDPWNQLKVAVEDMHTSALGIDKISVLDQDSAADAVDIIKNAINSVSSTRGTLGATQNRLEHTQNNLSVMAENITDAESSIRDTDVADEMMAYTKNNILIQSAQAMLAQANAVPQGVLQLLG